MVLTEAILVPAGTTLSELVGLVEGAAGNDDLVRADLLFDGSGYRAVISGRVLGLDLSLHVAHDEIQVQRTGVADGGHHNARLGSRSPSKPHRAVNGNFTFV